MPGLPSDPTKGVPDDPEFLYAVLNLPKAASDQEIRERYRQLSVLFHPDKQHDPLKTETATKRFLEVQKAYEVLSDPLARRAYDLLGLQGLEILSELSRSATVPDGIHASPEFEKLLLELHSEQKRVQLEDLIRSRGSLSATLDLSKLLAGTEEDGGKPLDSNVMDMISSIRRTELKLRHSVERKVSERTSVTFSGSHESHGRFGKDRLVVGVTHRCSPHILFKTSASTSTVERFGLTADITYSDKYQTALVRTSVTKALIGVMTLSTFNVWVPPPTTVAYTRRLFRDSPVTGSLEMITLSASRFPVLRVGLGSWRSFGRTGASTTSTSDEDDEEPATLAPSKSGLSTGSHFWNFGILLAFAGAGPSLNAEFGTRFIEIGVTMKTALQYSLISGLSWVVGGEWSKGRHFIGTSVEFGFQDVTIKFDFATFGQQLSLPITLSHERNLALALYTTVIPATGLLIGYYFILRPQRRKARIEFFRKARRQLREEKADIVREVKETTALLQEIAKRHVRSETACDGLIIMEASYGPSERDETTEGLDVDVTVPIQALVSQSQVYIPGRRSKAGLQGFYDPVPAVAKTLRVRYTFRGRLHYAEFPDYAPVVLPLQDHLVE